MAKKKPAKKKPAKRKPAKKRKDDLDKGIDTLIGMGLIAETPNPDDPDDPFIDFASYLAWTTNDEGNTH